MIALFKTLRRYLAIAFNQTHPMKFLISRILWRSGILAVVRPKFRFKHYLLYLSPSSLSMALWLESRSHGNDSDVLASLLRVGDHYVDVGANIGHLAIEARSIVKDKGSVVAIEGHPRTAIFLRDNLLLNHFSDVKVANIAIGANSGWVHFSNYRTDDQNAVLSSGGVEVPCMPLDNLGLPSRITVLKIDVEGYELFVLHGAETILSRTQFILFEAWDKHFAKYGYEFSAVADFLHFRGFELGIPNGNSLNVVDSLFRPSNCTNVLAYRSRDSLIDLTRWTIVNSK